MAFNGNPTNTSYILNTSDGLTNQQTQHHHPDTIGLIDIGEM